MDKRIFVVWVYLGIRDSCGKFPPKNLTILLICTKISTYYKVYGDIDMNTLTATNARSNLFNLLKDTVKGHLLTRISSKDGNAILISEDDYESILETAELLSVDGFRESISKADNEIKTNELFSIEEAFK